MVCWIELGVEVQRRFAGRSAIRIWVPEERRRDVQVPAEPLDGPPQQNEVLLEVLTLVVAFLSMATIASLLLLVIGSAAP